MRMPRYCRNCGTGYEDKLWPRTCKTCGEVVWKNPLPVSFILQPMTDGNRIGLLVLKRAIEPHFGGWSLPGGFIDDNGESAEEAAVRELYEETGIKLSSTPKLLRSLPTGRGQLLFACESREILEFKPEEIVLCSENSDFRVAWEAEKLAFPLHAEVMAEWFNKQTNI